MGLAGAVLVPGLATAGNAAGAQVKAPAATCPSASACAAPWMAHVTNLTLGRTPTDSDYGTMSATADPDEATRSRTARRLLTSLEGRRFTVELQYWKVLQRGPDPSGADFWPRALVDGRRNAELLEGSLLGSHEFSRRWPDWITQMYDVVLARRPDPDGLAYWRDQATRSTQERVARRFLATAAARRERSRIVHASLLAQITDDPGRPTAGEIAHGASLLARFTGEDDLIVELLSSEETYIACQSET